jgi:hypothetical protein
MSLFNRDPKASIEAELTKLRAQRTDAQQRLDTAQAVANTADDVDDCAKKLAEVASLSGVVATFDARIVAAERRLHDIDRGAIESRRDELRKILSRDLSGFATEMAELVKAELAARIALASTLEIRRRIHDRARAAESELAQVLTQLGEPKANASPIGSNVIRGAQVEVARQLQERYAGDRDARWLAMSGIEDAGHQLLAMSRETKHRLGEIASRHDAKSPARPAIPGLNTPQPKGLERRSG